MQQLLLIPSIPQGKTKLFQKSQSQSDQSEATTTSRPKPELTLVAKPPCLPELDGNCRLCGQPIAIPGLDSNLCSNDCGYVRDSLTWLNSETPKESKQQGGRR
ncbi:hypothetical protein IQ268_28350 [Oculatella sp. LEGE 06141]|uniref:hypothetical protein n=1 Tax=Oculatella sp. LEGE 06141 TaxID=1828648 RepID=UPI00187F306D|nr:hypothetical protein [Oculatella sp. LEGE 06141]MBE9182465.1 hypothetical protein [Oculatella sp. LEGE 06141]